MCIVHRWKLQHGGVWFRFVIRSQIHALTVVQYLNKINFIYVLQCSLCVRCFCFYNVKSTAHSWTNSRVNGIHYTLWLKVFKLIDLNLTYYITSAYIVMYWAMLILIYTKFWRVALCKINNAAKFRVACWYAMNTAWDYCMCAEFAIECLGNVVCIVICFVSRRWLHFWCFTIIPSMTSSTFRIWEHWTARECSWIMC